MRNAECGVWSDPIHQPNAAIAYARIATTSWKNHVGDLHAAAVQQRNITVDHIRNMRREGGRSPLRLESNGLKRAVHTGHVNVVTIIGGGNATS